MSKLSCLCTAVFTTHDISGKLQRSSGDSSPRCGLHIGETIGSLFALIFFQVKRHDIYWKQFLRFKSIHLQRDGILCLNSTFVLICSYMLSVYPPAMIAGTQCCLQLLAPLRLVTYVKISIFIHLTDVNEGQRSDKTLFTKFICPCIGNQADDPLLLFLNHAQSL